MTTETQAESQNQTTEEAVSPEQVMFGEAGTTVVKTGEGSDQDQADNKDADVTDAESQESQESSDEDTLLAENNKESDNQDAQKDGEGDAEDKTDDESEEAIDYDLKLPKDGLIDDAVKDRVQELAAKHKLTNEAAQEILDQENETLRTFEERMLKEGDEAIANQVAEWNKELQSTYGDELKGVDVRVTALLKAHGPEGIINDLREAQLERNPKLVALFNNIAKIADSDTLKLGGNRNDVPDDSPQGKAATLFPLDKIKG